MMDLQPLARLLILLGVVMVGVGALLMFFDRIPLLGKLPGDISIKRENFQLYIPITTSIVLSLLISLVLWIFTLIKGK